IIEQIEAGVPAEHYKKTISITNRKEAIKIACQIAEENDIILIAGKGHETYQEINGERFDFDDFKIVNQLLTALNK
ncbi:MAG: UDP-N-acetylmuramoyl-L-alanyl-D-glutamate--2,6-diaminopimelate ligase, partial [Aequorivita sp.]|nr:UDP-N-acetylmuramoyl-L-alanyl-D-glutamate--2,6-diaminopimelate ligase [Aequorivita sp.]